MAFQAYPFCFLSCRGENTSRFGNTSLAGVCPLQFLIVLLAPTNHYTVLQPATRKPEESTDMTGIVSLSASRDDAFEGYRG